MGRPITSPELGRLFAVLREARGLGQREAAHRMRLKGHVVSDATIQAIESGRTNVPTPDVLKAMAEVYRKPYADLVAEVARHYYGIRSDLLGSRDLVKQAASKPGGSPDADPYALEARLLGELAALEEHDVELRKTIRRLSAELLSLAGPDDARPEDRKDPPAPAAPRGGARGPRR